MVAKADAKHMSLEKLLSKLLEYHYDEKSTHDKTFKEQLKDEKVTKLETQNYKLTSIEPN